MVLNKQLFLVFLKTMFAAALIIFSVTANAQSGGDERMEAPKFKEPGPDDIAESQTDWMKRKLKLNKEQLAKIKTLNTDYAYKRNDYVKAIKLANENAKTAANKNADKFSETNKTARTESQKKLQDKLDLIDAEKEKELKLILTEKQFETYLKKKAELQLNTGNNDGTMPPPPPPGGF